MTFVAMSSLLVWFPKKEKKEEKEGRKELKEKLIHWQCLELTVPLLLLFLWLSILSIGLLSITHFIFL